MPDEYGDELEFRSPNHNRRPADTPITLIVLHADADTKGVGTLKWLCNPDAKVSYHGLISPDGTFYQLVDPERRAWHAGKSEWNGVKDVNDFSLGLCFDNPHDGVKMLTAAQISVAKAVIQAWGQRFPITDVVTHAMIAPGRKVDPEKIPNFYLADFQEALREASVDS